MISFSEENSLLFITVDLDAIVANTSRLKASLRDGVKLLAIVKSDAYGHGILEASRAVLSGGADYLGVVNVKEGLMLREGGISAPTVVLGAILPAEAPLVVSKNLDVTVFNRKTVEALANACQEQNSNVGVFIKVDTGMGRLGVFPDDAIKFAEYVGSISSINIKGLITHFPIADQEDKTFTHKQINIMNSLIGSLREKGFELPLNNCANSAAIIDMPEAQFDMVRAGIAMYGYYPSRYVSRSIELKPALTLRARVMSVKRVKAGTPISYGCRYRPERDTIIGVVPIGYRHGYHRMLSGKTYAIYKGKRVPQVGTICMDMCMYDFGPDSDISDYEWITLLGEEGSEAVWADELAGYAETIMYEILTSLSGRIDRVYIQGGEVVDFKEANCFALNNIISSTRW